MSSKGTDHQVIICGAGPVGLYLAIRLIRSGVDVLVLEKKEAIDPHSKSLGIHPVSLELFDEIGISEPFIDRGVKIQQGAAFINDRFIGEISFDECKPPHNYILALPQNQTEEILEKELYKIAPDALIRCAEVRDLKNNSDYVSLTITSDTERKVFRALFVIGCDGKNSFVRESAGIKSTGRDYPDTYTMGDFSDNTDLKQKAGVYLHKDGMIESFPLPNGTRRWVVKTDHYLNDPSTEFIGESVQYRIGHSLEGTNNFMLSSFGVQHYLADTLAKNRVALAGDAAHVVSPIGGQGMNLGWIGADVLADCLISALSDPEYYGEYLKEYSVRQRKTAKKVAKRAELNMWFGRKRVLPLFKPLLIRMMVQTPLRRLFANMFTMRGL
jgi:2-polyprenyl-6-methoxyphenol hydroxylase-like FAD-dependent oxidoreductase